jgi:hypothetical protein
VIRCHRIPFSTNVERVALAAGHKTVTIEWIDGDDDRFHTVLAKQVTLRRDSPLHAWVSRVDALPRS